MSLVVPGTFNGRYETSTTEELACADFVIGHEFAAPSEGFGRINEELAKFIAEHFPHLPVFVAETVAGALGKIAPHIEIVGVFEGTSSNTTASEGGTWEELKQAMDMAGDGKRNSIHVGQGHHIGRIALQAKKAGLNPLIPEGLPTQFDPESSQWWCRNRFSWSTRGIVGSRVLRKRGHL